MLHGGWEDVDWAHVSERAMKMPEEARHSRNLGVEHRKACDGKYGPVEQKIAMEISATDAEAVYRYEAGLALRRRDEGRALNQGIKPAALALAIAIGCGMVGLLLFRWLDLVTAP